MDGFPRTLTQAQASDKGLQTRGRQIDTVIYLDVGCEELYRRIAVASSAKHTSISITFTHAHQGLKVSVISMTANCISVLMIREKPVRSRLETFFTQTIRLLDYYRTQRKAVKVNGDQTIEKVHQDIIDRLRVPEHALSDRAFGHTFLLKR